MNYVKLLPDRQGWRAAGFDFRVSNSGVLSVGRSGEPGTVSPAFDITSPQISNWNTAYSWGDHASAGYQLQLGFTPENSANKGLPNGYVGLDGTGKISATFLPAYVDDVLEFANLAGFPGTGSTGIIYVAIDTGKAYRWSGSAYIEISASPGSTDSVPEGSTNLYFTTTRASNAAPVQTVAGRTGAIVLTSADVGLGNVPNINATNPANITQSATYRFVSDTQIGNWNTAYGWGNHASAGYLTSFTELDPVFSASPAFGITAPQISNWNTAYSWGNHASAGYLTSFTELDPVFGASPAAGITAPQISNWNTAYGWGNHATAGYETTTQLNARDTANRNRANHTGTQPWNTITGTPTTTAGYGITDAAFNGQIINGVAHFVQNAAPTTRINAAGQNIGSLVAGDQWTKPTDNGIPGTAGGWIWTGSDWVSVNVFPLSIPFVNGSSNNQTIRSESAGTNLGIRVSGIASQIAVLNANPTSSNYWTAAISISGTPVTTLSTQNAVSYPHNYSTPNTVIPARASIPVGGTLTATALGQTSRQWYGMTTLGTDVYAGVYDGDIYKQTNGTGNFLPLGQTSRLWYGMTTLGTDVYACVLGGDIYKQTNGTGNFVALGQTLRSWRGMTTLGTDVYACVQNGDIYKQTNGTGSFIALGQTSRDWWAMTTLGTDVYASVDNGDIYKQTNGTGNFVPLGQISRRWLGMTTLGTDVYACIAHGDIYKQTNGTGDFLPLSQTSRFWNVMTTLGTDVYAGVLGGDIYRLTAGAVTSIGHSLEVTLTRTGAASLPYVSITANCQVIHP